MASDEKGARETVIEYTARNLGRVDATVTGSSVISAVGIIEIFIRFIGNILQKCRRVIAD